MLVPGPRSWILHFLLPTLRMRGQVQKGHTWPPLSLADLGPSQVRCFLSHSWISAVPVTASTVLKPHTPGEGRPMHTEGRPASCSWLPPALGFSGAVRKSSGSHSAVHSKGDQLSNNPRVPRPPKIWCCDCLCCLQLPGFVQITKNDHKSQVLCRASCWLTSYKVKAEGPSPSSPEGARESGSGPGSAGWLHVPLLRSPAYFIKVSGGSRRIGGCHLQPCPGGGPGEPDLSAPTAHMGRGHPG